ncbi:hypothetical protein XJ44_03910 [Thermosipho affectus]|uniref:ComF family protein n=1 Tax=Thermosipho affectus TaxID=660294 RepID=A0ABX3ILE9_9BACT|nr:hypothetical protein [Thermosipho affectus]ONN27463.1 hypothetical protein XJ44_03910 [Thermosipho affectus]
MNEYEIKIITKNNVPVNVDNPILKYEKDKNRKNNFLRVEIKKGIYKIGIGIILDFYNKFTITSSQYTHVMEKTNIGKKVYKLKYYKNPPLDKNIREKYIKEFSETFKNFIKKSKKQNLVITYVPSSSVIPKEIALMLGNLTNTNVEEIITINNNDVTMKDSKDIEQAIKNAKKKYKINSNLVDKNTCYIIIDDIMGTGASIITILEKLYEITGKYNVFLFWQRMRKDEHT